MAIVKGTSYNQVLGGSSSFTQTVSTAAGELLVAVIRKNGSNPITSVTLDGVALTAAYNNNVKQLCVFYMENCPTLTSKSLTYTAAGANLQWVSACRFTGVAISGSLKDTQTSTISMAWNPTSQSTGNLEITVAQASTISPYATLNSTVIEDNTSSFGSWCYYIAPNTSPVNTGFNVGGANFLVGVEFADANASTSAIKTIGGLSTASVKTIGGLAIASSKTWGGLA